MKASLVLVFQIRVFEKLLFSVIFGQLLKFQHTIIKSAKVPSLKNMLNLTMNATRNLI